MNYSMDLSLAEARITDEMSKIMLDAQLMTSKVVCGVSGGCMLATSVVLLCFYIKNYIDNHGKELGILKALGFSGFRLAKDFSVFGLNVFIGTAAGYAAAFCFMSKFYEVQNAEHLFPDIDVCFHPSVPVCLVLAPTVFFSVVSVFYSFVRLKTPVITLLKGKQGKIKRYNGKKDNLTFMDEVKRGIIRQRISLVIFVFLSAFSYSSTMQMSFSMKEYADIMMSVLMAAIGILFSCITLFLAVSSVVKFNSVNISLMNAFGYPYHSCSKAVLGGYRPFAYIGFAVGTGYQYGLLKLMVNVVFGNVDDIAEFHFNFKAFVITIVTFVVFYEAVMLFCSEKIKHISLKKIMAD
ncbi:MAG: ABC transporter permease [Eubacterium sp.]|nr:ABC transporter permease [Eubacterium sp.]